MQFVFHGVPTPMTQGAEKTHTLVLQTTPPLFTNHTLVPRVTEEDLQTPHDWKSDKDGIRTGCKYRNLW